MTTLWQRLLNWLAPVGAEDESGFHYGPERGSLNNPIVAGGVTHTYQTRAFAFNCLSGAYYGQWNCTLPTSPNGYSNFTSGGTNYWAGFAAWPGLASERIPGLKMRTNYFTGGVQ